MTNEHTSQKEFIFLVALLTAMVAMSIDTMLPAIGTMASEFGVQRSQQAPIHHHHRSLPA